MRRGKFIALVACCVTALVIFGVYIYAVPPTVAPTVTITDIYWHACGMRGNTTVTGTNLWAAYSNMSTSKWIVVDVPPGMCTNTSLFINNLTPGWTEGSAHFVSGYLDFPAYISVSVKTPSESYDGPLFISLVGV